MTGNVTRLFRSTSLPRRHGLRGWPIAVLGLLGSILISGDTPAATVPPPAADAVPTSDPQRVQAWDLLERLAGGSLAIAAPAASGWFTSEQTVPHAVADRAGTIARVMQSGGEELIVFALYNATAYHHIRNHPVTGRKTTAFPPFPANSAILLTAWWPVARQGLSPLPVWDPDANPPNPAGNGYLTWKRIVAIDPANAAGDGAAASLAFVGRLRGPARRVPLDTFCAYRSMPRWPGG